MKNKVVLITGGSSGIGFALAKIFLSHGANVSISGRDDAKLSEASNKLSPLKNLHTVIGDVSIEADCKRMVDETIQRFGKLDILICNAGISMRALFSELDLDVIRRVMNINFWGTVYCAKYALPHLLNTKGSIVGISSIAGKMGLPGRTGYSASKFAMEGFLETLRNEESPNGLHVLLVCPGFTQSNIRNKALTKDGSTQKESPRDEDKMMSADEVAAHVLKAISSRSRDVILTTEGKLSVFLKKFAPNFIDHMLRKKMRAEKDSPVR